jgi:hypothetical protein
MATPEIYVSTDVEADGPIPGPHSMLSMGSAAYAADGKLMDTFTRQPPVSGGRVPTPEAGRVVGHPTRGLGRVSH